jgi:hypothetical protein
VAGDPEAGNRDEQLLARLAGRHFQANPGYELVLFDRLPPQQRVALAQLQSDPDLYGVLRPRPGSGLRTKSVSRDAALLFLTMAHSGPLPSYVVASDDGVSSVTQLVMDGVLEIEVDGEFHSGAGAHRWLYPSESATENLGAISRLSRDAVRYGAALEVDSTLDLSMRLYSYHRLPRSPYWQARFPSPDAVMAHWGVPGRYWTLAPTEAGSTWTTWQSPIAARPDVREVYKLYVSPHPDDAPVALRETLTALQATNALCFKVGADLVGLLRPDKIVCYFAELEQLLAAAESVAKATTGMAAHGVPFTGELGGDGLLSWGIDPGSDAQAFGWLGRQSWRLWITNQLAVSLLTARSQSAMTVPAWRFALDRLELEGVDSQNWTPRSDVVLSFMQGGEAASWK